MDHISILSHLAIIVDGDRRWARKHNMPAFIGYNDGFECLEEVIDYAVKIGVLY